MSLTGRQTNVLVGDDGHALLSDFGLTGITDLAGSDLVTNTNESGGKKYMAPELHDPERFGVAYFRRTAASDMYSYGSLCLEVLPVFNSLPSSYWTNRRLHPRVHLGILRKATVPGPHA